MNSTDRSFLELSSIFSGIVFAAAFQSVARTLQKGGALRGYMIIAAYGFLLFYVAGSAVASEVPYPPFGLTKVLACYLIYVRTIFCQGAIVSKVIVPRQSIRKSVQEQSKFLEKIATGQMQQELQAQVLSQWQRRPQRL